MATIKMLHTKMNVHGVGETAQQLRELAGLAEDQSLVLSPHTGHPTTACKPSSRASNTVLCL